MTEAARVRELILCFVISAATAALFTAWISAGHPDFAIMWAGPQLAHPYDAEAVRSLISWPPEKFTPYVYLPNATLLFAPFALFPLSAALLIWTGLGGGLLGLCTRWAPALFFTPPVLWALPGGQTSLILGCLIFLGFRYVERPMLSGVLLGFSLVLKPQLAFVAPAAFLVADWRVSAYAAAIFLLSIGLSLAAYGPHAWAEWFNSLNPWLNLHSANRMLLRNEIAHGVPLWLKGFMAVAGIAFVAVERDRLVAFTVAICAALIASPHAMGYEFAMLAPAVIPLVRRSGPAGFAAVAFILTPAMIWIFPVVLDYMARLLAVILLVFCVAGPSLIDRFQADRRRRLQCA